MTRDVILAVMKGYISRRPNVSFSIDESIKDPDILALPNARPFTGLDSMGDYIAMDSDAFRSRVGVEHRHCSTNRPGLFKSFGPRDSSYDYYTGMIGGQRLVILDRQTFQQVMNPAPLTDETVCWPLMQIRWVY